MDIALDLMIVATAIGGTSFISQVDLVQVLSSGYCDLDTFLQYAVDRRRPILEDIAMQWLVDDQEMFAKTSLAPCADRAQRFALLSALAILHDKTDTARKCVVQSAEHLIGHAYHKDMLFYNVLGAIQRYAEVASTNTKRTDIWPWLVQLAPAIGSILAYTDGDETRNFPVELADTIAVVAPEKLPAYYHWQYVKGEYYQALDTLHAFLEKADLSEPIAQSLALTAIDHVSLQIIARRADQDDADAQTVKARQQAYLGENAFALTSTQKDRSILDGRNPVTFDYAKYPPAEFNVYLTVSSGYIDKQNIISWIDYWIAKGAKMEVYRALVDADARGIDIRCYDRLFMLARTLYGQVKAYPWLIKAQVMSQGWSWYMSDQNEAEQRWKIIKQYYPDRWYDFLQQTLGQTPLWRSVPFSHGEFGRLIKYCLFMDQFDLAQSLIDQMVKCSLDFVSMLPLPTPEWVNVS